MKELGKSLRRAASIAILLAVAVLLGVPLLLTWIDSRIMSAAGQRIEIPVVDAPAVIAALDGKLVAAAGVLEAGRTELRLTGDELSLLVSRHLARAPGFAAHVTYTTSIGPTKSIHIRLRARAEGRAVARLIPADALILQWYIGRMAWLNLDCEMGISGERGRYAEVNHPIYIPPGIFAGLWGKRTPAGQPPSQPPPPPITEPGAQSRGFTRFEEPIFLALPGRIARAVAYDLEFEPAVVVLQIEPGEPPAAGGIEPAAAGKPFNWRSMLKPAPGAAPTTPPPPESDVDSRPAFEPSPEPPKVRKPEWKLPF